MGDHEETARLIRQNIVARVPGRKRLCLKHLTDEEKAQRRRALRQQYNASERRPRQPIKTVLTEEQKEKRRQLAREFRQRRRQELERLRQIAATVPPGTRSAPAGQVPAGGQQSD